MLNQTRIIDMRASQKTLLLLFFGAFALAAEAGGGAAAKTKPQVKLQTNLGDIVLELYPDKAPKTVENFLRYVNEGFYNGTLFHRVINNFMIQSGGLGPDFKLKPTHHPIQNEADNGLKNAPGTIAMARTADPNSATSQFFINVANNDFLNHRGKDPQGWGYAVFGQVTEGMETVNAIKAVKTGQRGPHGDVPVDSVIIEQATVIAP
jgi:peptidyl-prolyl cis-trans isomerase B (cyclophilin B)